MTHFFFAVYTGPTIVKQTADRIRLHLAGCEVFEGTERAWVHIFADSKQTVARRLADLPNWMQPLQINEFK